MEKLQHAINISAPNLVNVCVDEGQDGEISGRLYHCYQEEPLQFSNLVQILRFMEELFDEIQFPQASTQTRSFFTREGQSQERKPRAVDQTDIIRHTGHKGTFIITVRFRQNSTWQGELFWMEREEKQNFSSTLDLIKILDGDMTMTGMETEAVNA